MENTIQHQLNMMGELYYDLNQRFLKANEKNFLPSLSKKDKESFLSGFSQFYTSFKNDENKVGIQAKQQINLYYNVLYAVSFACVIFVGFVIKITYKNYYMLKHLQYVALIVVICGFYYMCLKYINSLINQMIALGQTTVYNFTYYDSTVSSLDGIDKQNDENAFKHLLKFKQAYKENVLSSKETSLNKKNMALDEIRNFIGAEALFMNARIQKQVYSSFDTDQVTNLYGFLTNTGPTAYSVLINEYVAAYNFTVNPITSNRNTVETFAIDPPKSLLLNEAATISTTTGTTTGTTTPTIPTMTGTLAEDDVSRGRRQGRTAAPSASPATKSSVTQPATSTLPITAFTNNASNNTMLLKNILSTHMVNLQNTIFSATIRKSNMVQLKTNSEAYDFVKYGFQKCLGDSLSTISSDFLKKTIAAIVNKQNIAKPGSVENANKTVSNINTIVMFLQNDLMIANQANSLKENPNGVIVDKQFVSNDLFSVIVDNTSDHELDQLKKQINKIKDLVDSNKLAVANDYKSTFDQGYDSLTQYSILYYTLIVAVLLLIVQYARIQFNPEDYE